MPTLNKTLSFAGFPWFSVQLWNLNAIIDNQSISNPWPVVHVQAKSSHVHVTWAIQRTPNTSKHKHLSASYWQFSILFRTWRATAKSGGLLRLLRGVRIRKCQNIVVWPARKGDLKSHTQQVQNWSRLSSGVDVWMLFFPISLFAFSWLWFFADWGYQELGPSECFATGGCSGRRTF